MFVVFAGKYNISLTLWSREEVRSRFPPSPSVELAFYFLLEDPLIVCYWTIHPLPSTLVQSLKQWWSTTMRQYRIFPVFGKSSRKYWIWCTFLNWLINSKIFSLISKIFFTIFLSDLEMNLNLHSLNFQNTNWLTDSEELKYFLAM